MSDKNSKLSVGSAYDEVKSIFDRVGSGERKELAKMIATAYNVAQNRATIVNQVSRARSARNTGAGASRKSTDSRITAINNEVKQLRKSQKDLSPDSQEYKEISAEIQGRLNQKKAYSNEAEAGSSQKTDPEL
jgi:hypothetical protein